jgi:hypothetical protein
LKVCTDSERSLIPTSFVSLEIHVCIIRLLQMQVKQGCLEDLYTYILLKGMPY